MSRILFKLSVPDGLIRRFSYPEQPTWLSLASKISELYHIPVENLAVSYLDADGDEVTLSSEEELNDFYQISYKHPEPVKFTVHDLRSLRQSAIPTSKALPDTPRMSGGLRTTFGGAFDIEDDWQIPGLGGLFQPTDSFRSSSPHAFLEAVESDAGKTEDRVDKPSLNGSDLLDLTPRRNSSISVDKGKSKAYEPSITDSISSTGSVLAEDAPPKHPLHVYDMSSLSGAPISNSPSLVSNDFSPVVISQPIPASDEPGPENTPVAADISPAKEDTPDPPVPVLDEPAPTPDTRFLSQDLANLLNTLTSVISTHPELSEAVRNVMRNATNGVYWQSHRDAISRGAEEIIRTAQAETGKAAEDIRRITEEEAGRRVADALGGVFRLFSDLASGGGDGQNPANAPPSEDAAPTPTPASPGDGTPRAFDATPIPAPPFGPGGRAWHAPPLPPQVPDWYRPSIPRVNEWVPSPLPPPPPRGHFFHGPPHGHHLGPHGFNRGHGGPHYGPFPPFPPFHGPPMPPPPPPLNNDEESELTPQQAKTEYELARTKYKAQKERYRSLRRRGRLDKSMNISSDRSF
jgi:PB1 domain